MPGGGVGIGQGHEHPARFLGAFRRFLLPTEGEANARVADKRAAKIEGRRGIAR